MTNGIGLNRHTGGQIEEWPHVAQSLGDIFTTRFGERVMRRYYGSLVPRLLGENMVPETFLRYFTALAIALLQEPRVRLITVEPLSVDRSGVAWFRIELEYRPRALFGDFTPSGRKRVRLAPATSTFTPEAA